MIESDLMCLTNVVFLKLINLGIDLNAKEFEFICRRKNIVKYLDKKLMTQFINIGFQATNQLKFNYFQRRTFFRLQNKLMEKFFAFYLIRRLIIDFFCANF